jgi:thiamine pyrophosphokinase
MTDTLQDNRAITLVGGGETAGSDLTEALRLAPRLVAADGGANHCARLGHLPEQVIGDLDSLAPDLRRALGARVIHVPDQDSTDLDKCLARLQAPFILALGFDGARLDHTLAAMTSLVWHGSARVLMIAAQDIVFLAPPRLELPIEVGARVSLFPMRPVTGRSTGLHWPIDGLAFRPEDMIGTSNHADATLVTLDFDTPGMLVLLERDHLEAALAALLKAPDWRAH